MTMELQLDTETKAELERLELLLLDPEIRRDRALVDSLLTADFVEFGSSGRVWTRETTLDLLATEAYTRPQAKDFAFRLLSAGVVLVTYRTERTDSAGQQSAVLRSSIWTRESGSWKICFHQGTRAS